ncbi:MAG: DUF2007 domain-containing protein [Anaerolineae bacterium]|jgi:hypothetical protein|nr:DUF2007 domain-containing protein [Anaerolineae bacterium]
MSNFTSSQSDSEWTVVFSTPSRPEAFIVMGRLENEGIPALLNQEAGRDALGIHIGRLGEIQVLVHDSQAETARMILDYIIVEADDYDTRALDGLGDTLIWDEDEMEDPTGLPDDDEAVG